MDLENRIAKIVEDSFDVDEMFLVDINIAKTKGPKKVKILIDNDKGLNIDQCALISRKVGEAIESETLIEGPYVLEVSSPGLDYPLTLKRQYEKNIGRKVKVLLHSGEEKKGELLKVNDNSIVISLMQKGKKKKLNAVETEILLNDIQKTNVLVSFK